MYHTPGGDRILLGAERRLFTQSLTMVVDLLAEGDMPFDVAPFDELQRNQKLVVLYHSARALLQPDEPTRKLTAYVESAVAAVFEFVKTQVCQEIDEPESYEKPSHWRKLVLEAARAEVGPDELPDSASDDKEMWDFLVECLAGCVLWDNDYECQESLDLPPEESSQLRDRLGVDQDYYTDVPYDPPDDQSNLYLDALRGLTADGRSGPGM